MQEMQNKNAHVIAKLNEEYFKSSTVKTPLDEEAYGRIKKIVYGKTMTKFFEQVKREFTYESKTKKVNVNYTIIDDTFKGFGDGFKAIAIVMEEPLLSGQHQTVSVNKDQLDALKEILPTGYEFQHVQTSVHYFDVFDRWFGKIPKPCISTTITYYKKNKKRGDQ